MVRWSELVIVAKLIYEQAEKAKINKMQAVRLAERVRLLIDAVEKAGNISDKEGYDTQQKEFKATIDEVLELISEFHSQHWFYRFSKAGGWKDELAEINEKLTDHAEAFDLSMDLEGFLNREADRQALSEDMEDLRHLIVEAVDADHQTKEHLETVVSALGVLKNNTDGISQSYAVILNKLDRLAHALGSAIPTGETEIVVVDEGATVGKLINRYVAQEYNFKAPNGTSNAQMNQLKRFTSELRQGVPENKVNLTVVKKGGHVDDLLHEAKNFLLSFELTTLELAAVPTKQPASRQREEILEPPSIRPQQSFWQKNRFAFYTTAALVVGAAVVASQSETIQNYLALP